MKRALLLCIVGLLCIGVVPYTAHGGTTYFDSVVVSNLTASSIFSSSAGTNGGVAIRAISTSTSNQPTGIQSETYGPGGYGIVTLNYGTYSTGIYAHGKSTGVYGKSNGYGVYAFGGTYDFYAAGGGIDYGTSSSIRWKSNIQEIDNALDKVMNMRGVYFDWDEEHGGQHGMGFIAEEVGEQVPEVVAYEENGVDATGMDYGHLTPVLVQAIKEQQAMINELKAEIKKLKKEDKHK